MGHKLTPLQRQTLRQIAQGEIYQLRFGSGAWRIMGGSPTVVGKLIAARLAEWRYYTGGERHDCDVTEEGRALLEQFGDAH